MEIFDFFFVVGLGKNGFCNLVVGEDYELVFKFFLELRFLRKRKFFDFLGLLYIGFEGISVSY